MKQFKFIDVTQKATTAFAPFFLFDCSSRRHWASLQFSGWAPKHTTKGTCHLEQALSPPCQALTVQTENTVSTPVQGLLSIPLALGQQLIIHTLLMSGMHLWDIYQGLSHNLWPQNKVNLSDPHGTGTGTWPLGPIRQPQEINRPRTSSSGGVSLVCSWPCPCKHFLNWNKVECRALPFEALILFSSVYIGTSPVAFKASKYAVLYKLTKLANNCLMTA